MSFQTFINVLVPFNFSSPKPAKAIVMLLCLTPSDFTRQWRVSVLEMVNWAYLPILFLNLSSPKRPKLSPLFNFTLSNARRFYLSMES